MSISEDILAIFHSRGLAEYFGESVSITEHALQAAYFARPPARRRRSSSPRCCTTSDTSSNTFQAISRTGPRMRIMS